MQWALSSAEGFARGAVGLLDSLGVVDYLSFGSECGSVEPLERIAEALLSPSIDAEIRAEAQTGESYAVVRERVLERRIGEEAKLIETPNNILAVEYIKAIYDIGSRTKPLAVQRKGAGHDRAATGRIRSARRAAHDDGCRQVHISLHAARGLRGVREGAAAGEGAGADVPAGGRAAQPVEDARARGLRRVPDATEGLENRLLAAMEEPHARRRPRGGKEQALRPG